MKPQLQSLILLCKFIKMFPEKITEQQHKTLKGIQQRLETDSIRHLDYSAITYLSSIVLDSLREDREHILVD